jgi:dTDP-4-amino-4,6-dideoxy-D-galactose acyltransferase
MFSFPDLPADSTLCRQLVWDTEFFQKRIARATPERITEESVREIMAWCAPNRIDCLYLLVTADDFKAINLLEESGFHFVAIRTTLEFRIDNLPPQTVESRIRDARPDDVPALRAIAGVSHVDSRFYNDGHFPEERCRVLYETWIEKSVNKGAQAVLVADWADEPVGYITCHLSPGVAEIGLLGVSEQAQGKGLGNQLLRESLRWFKQHGATEVTVVTQGHTVRAQRVYQKAGFVPHSIQLWFHYWPSSLSEAR